jgi:hypothetical protein
MMKIKLIAPHEQREDNRRRVSPEPEDAWLPADARQETTSVL